MSLLLTLRNAEFSHIYIHIQYTFIYNEYSFKISSKKCVYQFSSRSTRDERVYTSKMSMSMHQEWACRYIKNLECLYIKNGHICVYTSRIIMAKHQEGRAIHQK